MTTLSSGSHDAMSLPWKLSDYSEQTAAQIAGAVTDVMVVLNIGLSRWIGASGYCTLLERAVTLTCEQHSWLTAFPCPEGDAAVVTAAADKLGNAAVTAGVSALLTQLVDLLGRILGEEMAARLVTQTYLPTPPTPVKTDMEN